MATLSIDDVKKVADLARIALSEQDTQQLPNTITSIFGILDQIQNVDTGSVQPMASQASFQPLREDAVTETNQRDALQACANGGKNTEAGLYLVPKVIE